MSIEALAANFSKFTACYGEGQKLKEKIGQVGNSLVAGVIAIEDKEGD